MIPESSRLNIRFVLTRADSRWAMDNNDDAIHPERMAALIEAVETSIGRTGVERLQLDLANARALIGRLVEAVRGRWDPARDQQGQIRAALDELRQVERYLLSLNEDTHTEVA